MSTHINTGHKHISIVYSLQICFNLVHSQNDVDTLKTECLKYIQNHPPISLCSLSSSLHWLCKSSFLWSHSSPIIVSFSCVILSHPLYNPHSSSVSEPHLTEPIGTQSEDMSLLCHPTYTTTMLWWLDICSDSLLPCLVQLYRPLERK